MRLQHVVLASLLLVTLSVHSQPQEVLRAVDEGQSRRLEEYNRVFLQEELYSAARHRVVSINTTPLLQQQAVTITPFPDMKPVVVTPERVQSTDNYVNWFGRIQVDDPELQRLELKLYAPINLLWWDLDKSGNVSLSGSNRSKFSPAWRIDEKDQPVLMPDGVASGRNVGPAPRTPEEIAEHKRVSELERRAFASFGVTLELPSGQTYVVSPLRHTPRYAVVYEVDKDKVVPRPFESGDPITAEQRAKVEQYDAFRRGLPVEDKAIRGDIR